jgi:uncharacterized membrane protein
MEFKEPVELASRALDGLGVALITGGTLAALGRFAFAAARRAPGDCYGDLRRRLSRALLVGLEVLVAAEIVHSVATARTFRSVGVLACVVLVRTLLTIVLAVELTGAWPWRRAATEGAEE